MPVATISGGNNGIAFLVSAYGVYEVIAANCSSPQTTELNAGKRAGTLMKWVHLGIAQSAILVTLAVMIDKQHTKPIIAGAVLAAGFMEVSYLHARKSGLQNGGPTTETW